MWMDTLHANQSMAKVLLKNKCLSLCFIFCKFHDIKYHLNLSIFKLYVDCFHHFSLIECLLGSKMSMQFIFGVPFTFEMNLFAIEKNEKKRMWNQVASKIPIEQMSEMWAGTN